MVTHSEKVAKISSRIVEISDGKIIRDEYNVNYKKNTLKEKLISDKIEDCKNDKEENKILNDLHNNKRKTNKEGHLSFYSALKLSFHNMMASKTKNILMAVGVSISLIALILMLSLGAGLTSYIDTLAQDYSNPNYVTISKSGYDKDGNELEENANPMIPRMFENIEIEEVTNDINSYLSNQNSDFQIINSGENQNITFGFSAMTIGMGYIYPYVNTGNDSQDDDISTNTQSNDGEMIVYTYTTPPYYTEENLIAGTMSGMNEIMLSSAAIDFLGLENAEDIENQDYYVNLNINMTYDNILISINKTVKVTAIIDVSLFSSMMVMYLDYNFLNECVIEAQTNAGVVNLQV